MATAELAESLAEVAESSARLALVAAMAAVMAAVEMAVVAGLLAMMGQQEGRVELLVTAVTTVVGAGEEILWEQAEERSPRRPQAGPEQGEPSLLQTTRQP